ncbi:UDP-N-acetylmuramoyl-L-alanine--D-glutamate ligase [Synechococcus sp. CS-602]|uniref:UDP-N-acetylmuramoyl-L-alanine--D-glutamate ligase n=1 Tax=Synechococcaceae TaxID=1890426 RepID=UPI0008FF4917|nr:MULTISPECIES: UDP-N-acetylmuramoyl-L-alanine--D-glutamate ligase [Synechococcaceae]MCT4364526.1 UDP-N-acetylmuramoyl-L-alanine--D-glutamate ligase [Candidatus Regnicoccus frigidus MAG-AL1]APD48532.1 UDP-N-acetylmuramoylalanine--D-glutamate ligase [Synechococcus sp. SynAce01]MCT0203189.1 UDP-N-acetylmuramoyl-L-alanine--D-glutamate ligase [Synechococcus sp. CS-603]MCT0205332.1 UDP-N-acetylmuramoyl-L-alanine--D-glutamate ligase [Synechococcus sp. CS-602]MCT0246826.1 UDP-N-acetylmuramoyl-L-alan
MTDGAHPFSVVIGMGRSGIGAARLLATRGERVLLMESRQTPELDQIAQELRAEGIDVALGTPLRLESFSALFPSLTNVVVSPGIPWDHAVLQVMRQQGLPVCGELSVAWEFSRATPWIGITGTNGKTTVTHLVAHLLERAGLDAPMGGNVGRSAAELMIECQIPGAAVPDWLVVELSSYQIEASPELAPQIGLWTTLTPDHLERHGTLANYRSIKRGLLNRCESRILNADDPDLLAHAASWDRADWVTAGRRQQLPAGLTALIWVEEGVVHGSAGPLFPADCLQMPGSHNRQNMLMAAAVGLKLGIEASVMEAAFRSFPGVPHRLEKIRDLAGASWYNDSKATNYDAAEVALAALPSPMVVLAGGQVKQGDPQAWLKALDRQAGAVVLYGEARETFAALLASSGYGGEVHAWEGLSEAVAEAGRLVASGDYRTVLLSPACASFDQYGDFEARGNHFRSLVTALEP